MSSSSIIKQIANCRRRPGLTRKEYFDYHFQKHGAIAAAPDDLNIKPKKYTQTHVFDSAYGSRPGTMPNANHAWICRDDVTELYFRDLNHVLSTMASTYVQDHVGPDGLKFADIETSTAILVREHTMAIDTRLATEIASTSGVGTHTLNERVVAMLFLARIDGKSDGEDICADLETKLARALNAHASDAVSELVVNVGFTTDQFDVVRYFGGEHMPRYSLVFKMVMRDIAAVANVRLAQESLQAQTQETIDWNVSYILFGKEALVYDTEPEVQFEPRRQPVMPDLSF